jgi:hypothetical protein
MSATGLDPWLSASVLQGDSGLEVPVAVTLGGALTELFGGATGVELERRVHERVRELLRELGVPGEPVVEIGYEGERALQLRVHDRRLPYPAVLMKRVWLESCPPELSHACLRPETEPDGSPDRWLHSFVSEEALSDAARDGLVGYIAELVSAIVALRPSCLLSPTQLQWFAESALPGQPRRLPGWPASVLDPLLGELLDQGIALTRLDDVREALEKVKGLPPRDPITMREGVYGRLALDSVGVVMNPGHLAAMGLGPPLSGPMSVYETDEHGEVKVSPDLDTSFVNMEAGIYWELGISLPNLLIIPDDEMPLGWLAVRVNDRTGQAFPVPSASEYFVNSTVEELHDAGIAARPAPHPLLTQTWACIDAQSDTAAEDAGLTTWNAAEFTTFFVNLELKRVAGRLVTSEYVEYKLAQLEESHPELTLSATADQRVSTGELTLVLRQLVKEGLSVQDLRLIVDCILSHRPVTVDPDTHHLSDVRYPLPAARDSAERWLDLVEVVRGRMKLHIAYRFRYGPGGTVLVYLLDPAIEADAAAMAAEPPAAGEDLAETLRRLCSTEWYLLPPHVAKPAILTTAGARAWVRRAIETELPEMAVLSYLELPPDINVMPMARITPQLEVAD